MSLPVCSPNLDTDINALPSPPATPPNVNHRRRGEAIPAPPNLRTHFSIAALLFLIKLLVRHRISHSYTKLAVVAQTTLNFLLCTNSIEWMLKMFKFPVAERLRLAASTAGCIFLLAL